MKTLSFNNEHPNTLKIGVVGFSRNAFDQDHARTILTDYFTHIKQTYPNHHIKIVSGYTNMGVPKIAYELAKEFGFVTVGFSARQALKVKSGLFPVDEVMLRGNKFGDESEAFVEFIDLLIRVGGGMQSRHEVEIFKKRFKENKLSEKLQEHEVTWLGKD